MRSRSFAARAALALLTLWLGSPGRVAADDDGAWGAFAPPGGRSSTSLVYDSLRDRFLFFGGWDSKYHDDVWELPRETREWRLLATTGTRPTSRSGQAAWYDPVRDRLLIVGGVSGTTYLGDTWALSLAGTPAWTSIPATGLPGRQRHALLYDASADRLLAIGGGNSSQYFSDLWALSLASPGNWSPIVTTGWQPWGQVNPMAIVDPLRHRVLALTDSDTLGYSGTVVWALDLDGGTTWSFLSPAGTPPSPRREAITIYDPAGDRLILHGGRDAGNVLKNDTWALSLSETPTWSPIAATNGPAPRSAVPATVDESRNELVLYGGYWDGRQLSDVLTLPLTGSPDWTTLETVPGSFPASRSSAAFARDPVRDRLLLYGGSDGATQGGLWSFAGDGIAGWLPLATSGADPGPRTGASMIYDAAGDRMILFGGRDGGFVKRNDVWSLSLGPTPTWTQLSPAGTPPSPRWLQQAVYDPVGQRMVVFGGELDYQPPASQYPNTVSVLSLAGSPEWSTLAVSGSSPPGRTGHVLVYDPGGHRVVLFGGYGGYGVGYLEGFWTLSLGTPEWTQPSAGAGPSPAAGAVGVHDANRSRMVIAGRFAVAGAPFQAWALALDGGPSWTLLAPAGDSPSRSYHAAFFDPTRDRMVIYGGSAVTPVNDTWALTFAEPTAVPTPPAVASRLALSAPHPNPARTELAARFTLEDGSAARLELLDVAGRRVLVREVGSLGAGPHTLRLALAPQLPVGVYVLRLTQGGRSVAARAVVMR